MDWTAAKDAMLRKRYPVEGASLALVSVLGEPAWRVRKRATTLGVHVRSDVKKLKRLAYNPMKERT